MLADDLINELRELTQKNISAAESFKTLSAEQLKHKESADQWNILECIEHLIRYGDFYIPEIRSRIKNSGFKRSSTFRTGWLGDYFAKSMLPKDKLNKMNTFKSMNPIHSAVDQGVLDEFLSQQTQMLELLDQARNADLTNTKTSISISRLIKLRLGDTLRVVIYHNLRHIVQAKKLV